MSQPFIARRGPVGGGQGMSTGWDAARGRLEGLPGGGLNIAHEAVDRHVAAGHGVETAIVWLGREGERRVLTYAELAAEATRFAHVLRAHGIVSGDRMFLLSGRVPALYAATLGAMKAGVVVSPLFAAFGPEPVRARMELGDARVLLTTAQHYASRGHLPAAGGARGLRHAAPAPHGARGPCRAAACGGGIWYAVCRRDDLQAKADDRDRRASDPLAHHDALLRLRAHRLRPGAGIQGGRDQALVRRHGATRGRPPRLAASRPRRRWPTRSGANGSC